MRNWIIEDEEDTWSVKLDARNHLDSYPTSTRFRTGRSSAVLCGKLRCALALDFHGKLRILPTMLMHAAFRGIDASLVSQNSLTNFWSAFVAAVWSRRMPLANSGACLCLLDSPAGGDPGVHAVWSRF